MHSVFLGRQMRSKLWGCLSFFSFRAIDTAISETVAVAETHGLQGTRISDPIHAQTVEIYDLGA